MKKVIFIFFLAPLFWACGNKTQLENTIWEGKYSKDLDVTLSFYSNNDCSLIVVDNSDEFPITKAPAKGKYIQQKNILNLDLTIKDERQENIIAQGEIINTKRLKLTLNNKEIVFNKKQ